MKVVNLDQHGAHWHRWRGDGIGGSDAGVLMGAGFQRTRDQLIREKSSGTHTDVENERMERGKRLEPLARQTYEMLTGRTMKPLCVEHDKFPWLRASLDGWCERDKIILEIKCPGDYNHKKTLNSRQVPWYYVPQVMHQLLAADRAKCVHFWSFTNSDYFPPHERFCLVEVERDEEYLEELFKQEVQAMEEWKLLRKGKK